MRYILKINALSLVLAILFAAPVVSQFTYAIDDGFAEGAIGQQGGTTVWGNMFEVVDTAAQIDAIQIDFGVHPKGIAGLPATWAVFGDDDGNPATGLVLLDSGEHIIQSNSILTDFETIEVMADVSNFDWLFVAVLFTNPTPEHPAGPANLDFTTPQFQSWQSISGAETMDVSNWSESIGEMNNFTVRAIANKEILLGDVNLDGVVNLLDVAPFVQLLTDGGYQAEADINGDLAVDLLDVAPFVELLSG